jgi:small-conductance mechanosensitive channel
MQKRWLSISIGVLFFCGAAPMVSAQKVNTDSLSLVSKISSDQLKLGKLQNEVDQKTRDKKDAAEQAQKSANENTDAANKLSTNPQDKKYARRADNAASDARRDAKRARKASDRLDDLNKDIQNLQGRIAGEQNKLTKYAGAGGAAPGAGVPTQGTSAAPGTQTPVQVPVQPDTTRHN